MQTRQEVRVNELKHRVRNLLGIVTTVAARTLRRQDGSIEVFEQRLQALSRAQGLLNQHGSETVGVGHLVRTELAAHSAEVERVRVSGPEVHLTIQQVQNFALAVHELTTNALKYGALKDGSDRLVVTWEVVLDRRECRWLALSWIEDGVTIEPG